LSTSSTIRSADCSANGAPAHRATGSVFFSVAPVQNPRGLLPPGGVERARYRVRERSTAIEGQVSFLYSDGSNARSIEPPMSANPSPRFVADKTLGRLARWLRIVGCDVLYGPSGKGLLQAARRQHRIVLTRDRRLTRMPGMPPFLRVESDRFRDQLRQVIEAFAIDPGEALFRRCIDCNAELVEATREEVAGRVPAFVLATQTRFRRCPRCRHVYWDATHVARVRDELSRMGLPSGGAPAVAREDIR